jgi:spermidine dehydrogenase
MGRLLAPATLVAGHAQAFSASGPFAPSNSAWTGYGGIGDYGWSNGNTETVVQAAHGIRDHLYPNGTERATDESVDLVIVGGGFSGSTAAYEFSKRVGAGRTGLLLDNHPVMGGRGQAERIHRRRPSIDGPSGIERRAASQAELRQGQL